MGLQFLAEGCYVCLLVVYVLVMCILGLLINAAALTWHQLYSYLVVGEGGKLELSKKWFVFSILVYNKMLNLIYVHEFRRTNTAHSIVVTCIFWEYWMISFILQCYPKEPSLPWSGCACFHTEEDVADCLLCKPSVLQIVSFTYLSKYTQESSTHQCLYYYIVIFH